MKRKRIKPGSDSILCAYFRHEASVDEARAFFCLKEAMIDDN